MDMMNTTETATQARRKEDLRQRMINGIHESLNDVFLALQNLSGGELAARETAILGVMRIRRSLEDLGLKHVGLPGREN